MILERMDSPLGDLLLLEQNDELIGLAFFHRWERVRADLERHRGALKTFTSGGTRARTAVKAYFSGELDALQRIAWGIKGTRFQESVWCALQKIPVGQTWTYAELASSLGRPNSYRAVANAVGANPVSIVLPCHRVVGSSGDLTGYGGGLQRKTWLLQHEGVDV